MVGGTVASYMIPFADAGDDGGTDYTVAFTCNLDIDAAETVSEYDPGAISTDSEFETMNWTTSDVTVVPGVTEIVSFPPASP